MPSFSEEATHDVLASLVQGYLNHRSARSRGDQPKFINAGHAVLEFKTGLHASTKIARHNS